MIASRAHVRRDRLGTIPPQVLLLGSIGSVQFGAAFADTIFASAGPSGVAFLRVLFTAVVLCVVLRPRIAGRTPAELRLVAVYGLTLSGMNWSFYEALDHLPLGVAVTIEFTGPLVVAVAGSRRPLDAVWVLCAGGGVALLTTRGGGDGVQVIGVVLVLVAASCWAAYILLAKRVGASFAALDGLALGMVVGTLLVAPAGLIQGGRNLLHPGVLAGCLGVAVLSSLIPYSLELVALRRMSTAAFGLLMSVEPAVAALAGVVILGEQVSLVLGVALVLVITASVGSTLASRRPPEPIGGT